jgi:hypothetical protein
MTLEELVGGARPTEVQTQLDTVDEARDAL